VALMRIIKNFYDKFFTKKLNVNASDSARNLAVAIAEAATAYKYSIDTNPSGSFRALNVDPLVEIVTGAPTISQPLYGSNLKVELNGTTGTIKTGGVFAVNAYSLITGAGHTVDKNAGISVLADVGNNLAGTTITNNFSLEVNGVASRTNTVITNARSVVVNCPNHGSNRRGLLIGAERTTGLAVGSNNRSLEVLGTSNFIGDVFFDQVVKTPGVASVNKTGTNIPADNLVIAPGLGTGNATYASISFRGFPGSGGGSSGTTPHISYEIAKFVRERFILAGFTLTGVSGDKDDGVSVLQVNGLSRLNNYALKVSSVSADINISLTTGFRESGILLVNTTAGDITISTNAVSALTKNRVYIIKIIAGSNNVIFSPTTLIDGASTFTLSGLYSKVTITNDGTNWFII
jgi:hypothetical protein